MANILTFTPKKIKALRKQGSESLYFFQKGIWGDPDLDPELHGSLCNFLQAPGYRKVICAFRGSLKSSCFRAWLVWMGLYNVNWSAKLVEQRAENAAEHHRMIQDKFRFGPHAGLLQEMYSDRLLMDRWTSEKTLFNQTDPNDHAFLTHAGLTSRLESAHHDCIGGDDLEGADAVISDAPNAESERFVLNRAQPLLKKPETSHIVIPGTPHGQNPLVWKLRRLGEEQERIDPGNPLNWKIWWKEMLDSQGNSRWPERFSTSFIRTLKTAAKMSGEARRMWDQQYMMRERSVTSGFFDLDVIRRGFYELKYGKLMVYPVREYEDELLDPQGFMVEKTPVRKTIDLGHCRFYIHLDPIHKEPEDRIAKAESMWAIMVVAISPDYHAFLVDCWLEDAPFDKALEQFFLFYRKYAPYRVTIDPVGAQTWIKHFLRMAETTKYRNLVSLPTPWRPMIRRLPRPSSITEESLKANKEKEPWILEQLQIQFNMQWFHLHSKFEILLDQFSNVGTGTGFMDGPDALAQGPSFWMPPANPKAIAAMKKRKAALDMLNLIEPITGYTRRFNESPTESPLLSSYR